ncbi:MAG: response regulator [Phycisphaerae bacterium]|nr:response regulator [Phycisphaerae bacterium]
MANILLVDDDVDIIAMNKAVLESRGHAVTGAYSADEARAILNRQRPDLVVLDIMMESQTAGLELAREIHEHAPDLPLVMLSAIHEKTGAPFRFVPDEAWMPVQKFLDKPVDPVRLAEEIEGLLP